MEYDTSKVYAQRKTDRKYVACSISEKKIRNGEYVSHGFFGRLDLIGKGWNKYSHDYLNRSGLKHAIAYTKQSIESIVQRAYNNGGVQEAIIEADKHANTVNKYCSGCDNYYPSFKDEDFCLICGSAHTKRKDPDLGIPLENITDEDERIEKNSI